MQPRMRHVVYVLPDALQAMQAVSKAAHQAGVPSRTLELVHLRASQINGCGVCVDMHAHALKKEGESDERLWAVAAWRDAPFFTDAERAALALTESITRIADRSDAVPDEVWGEAARHFGEKELAALVLSIAQVNTWNRLNVATRQVAGVGYR